MREMEHKFNTHQVIAIIIGSIVFTIAFVVEQYILVWMLDYYDMGFESYVFEALLIGLVPCLLAIVISFVAYNRLSHNAVFETRCRKCGYILKGISEPKCSECGERI